MATAQAKGKGSDNNNAPIELQMRARKSRPAHIEQSPIIEGLCKKTDLHALPDWHSALSEKRNRDVVIWSIIVVLAVAALVWQLYETLNDFIQEPILSEYNLRTEGSMTLPDVYICPPMKLHQRNLAQLRSPYLALLNDRHNNYRRYMTFMYYHKTIGNASLLDEQWLEANALGLLDVGKDDFAGLLGSLSTAFDRDAAVADPPFGAGGGGSDPFPLHSPADAMLDIVGTQWRVVAPAPCERRQCPPRPPPYRVWTPADAQQFYMAAGFAKSQFVRECQIGAPDDGRGLRDCSRLVTEVFDPEYGKCFVLELNKYKVQQTVPGRGVSVVLDLNYKQSNPKLHELRERKGFASDDANCKMGTNSYPTEIEYSVDKCRHTLPKSAKCMPVEYQYPEEWNLDQCALNGSDDRPTMDGALVRISAPHDPAHKAAIYAQTGMRTSVLLSLTKMQMLDQKDWLFYPAKLCATSEEQETMMHMLSMRYSVGTCRLQCAMDDVYKRCDCIRPIASDFLKPNFVHTPYCNKQQMESCAINHEKLLKVRDKIHECTEKCLPPCDYNNFRTSVSMAKLVVQKAPTAEQSKEATVSEISALESPPLPADMQNETLAELGFSEDELYPKGRNVVCAYQHLAEYGPPPPPPIPGPNDKGPSAPGDKATAAGGEWGGNHWPPGENATLVVELQEYDDREQWKPPPEPTPCADIDMDALQNVTCWIKYFEHHNIPGVGCPYDETAEYGPDMEMALSELGISTQQQYDNHFEWWKRVGGNREKSVGDNSYRNRDDVIVLEIAYSEMQYVDIQQKHSMTLSTFIGNVGGQFGLWLGASIISIIKLLLLCCDGKGNKRAGAQPDL